MKISEQEWITQAEKVYKLLNIGTVQEIDMTIPEDMFSEYELEYQDIHNKGMSYFHIVLIASNYCSGPKITNQIKIKFGPQEIIDKDKKEIIFEFKYMNQLVLKIIRLLQPLRLSIKSANLTESKDIFSPLISTLD